VHWQARFLRERHALGLAPLPPATESVQPPSRIATMEEIQALALGAQRMMLDADEAARIEGFFVEAAWGPGRDPATAVPEAVSGRDLEGVAMQAEDHLWAHGLDLPTDPIERRRALYVFAKAMAVALKGKRLRDEGEVVETPAPLPRPASLSGPDLSTLPPAEKPAHALRLRDVYELWKSKSKAPAAKTANRALEVVNAFEEACGNPALVNVTRQDAQKLREFYLAKGLHPVTVKDRVDWVRVLLNYEVEEHGRLTSNPWPRVKVEGSSESATDRRDTREAELGPLFSQPLFQTYELPSAENAARDAAYWVPIMGALTGARITELAQLLTADVFEKNKLWIIAFRVTDPSWQRLKNKPSKREIPVHAELLRLGFLEYCRAMREAGHIRLFPMAKVSELNGAGGALSSWFSKLKTEVGWGREHTFHSFRHGVETILKRAKEPKPHIDRYTGHGGKDIADRDYTHLQAEDLVETASKVLTSGLNLPRVFPIQGWVAPPVPRSILRTKTSGGRGISDS
jgi:integrase